MTGYLHRRYAESLAEYGTPRQLPRSGGWILEREVPGAPYLDAMGCYPLFACRDWSQLQYDLESVEGDVLSLALVTDPFGEYDAAYLRHCFPDVARPFKEHYVVDLSRSPETFVSAHHRRYARKALRALRVERCTEPDLFLDDWVRLYATLVEWRNIRGIPAFSRGAFAKQLRVPGVVAFRAVQQGTTVGMMTWYVQGEIGYYHLGAYSAEGYDLRASFALLWHAIQFFAGIDTVRWLNLGGGAGIRSDGTDGLSRFKRGWATGTRTAYFCGRIFDRAKYAALVAMRQVPATDYFPAYRSGEFG